MTDTPSTTAVLDAIYRFPVKGLSPEKLPSVRLERGQTLPFDRAYAIENGTGKFDPDHPQYLPKVNFLMLMRHEKLATLKTVFNDETHELSISHDGQRLVTAALNDPAGRRNIETTIATFMQGEIRDAPHLVHAADHSFSDVSAKCLHIINLNSVRELERLSGLPVDPLRFRANLVIDGPPAFSELDWVGRKLVSGDIRLGVFKRTERCPATNVDPQTGERDRALPDFLFEQFGHRDFGIYAMVETGGNLTPGARFALR